MTAAVRRPPAGGRARAARPARGGVARRGGGGARAASGRPRRAGSAALVTRHGGDLVAGCAGPGGSGASANSAVPASHPPRQAAAAARPAGARASAAAAARRGHGQRAGGSRPRGAPARRRQSRPCSRRISASSALPAWRRTAHPAAGRPDRVGGAPRRPATRRQPASSTRSAEVGVLPEGAAEPLVEAADRLERRAPVGHVGGDPAGRGRAPRWCAPSRSGGGRPAAAPRCRPCTPPRPSARRRRGRRPASAHQSGPAPRRRRGRRPTARARPPATRCCGRRPGRGRRRRTHQDAQPRSATARQRRPARRPAGRRRPRPPRARAGAGRQRVQQRRAGSAGRASAPPRRTAVGAATRPPPPSRRATAAPDHERADGQQVDGRGAEALQGVPGVVHHGPAGGVEAGVDDDGQPGAPLERAPACRATSGSSRRSTVWMRAVPSTCTTAGMRSRQAGAHVVDEEHVRAGQRAASKISARTLGEHHRRDRPELLAALDVVEPLEVRRRARVGQQRAVAERARAVLAAPLEPGDDAVVGERRGDRRRRCRAGRS